MALVEDSHYKVVDGRGVLQGYFETKGLAHQYLLKEYPSKPKRRNKKKLPEFKNGQILPSEMYVIKVKRK